MIAANQLKGKKLKKINSFLESLNAKEILEWVFCNLPNKQISLTTSFQAGGIVLIDLCNKIGKKPPVFFVDTLYHFDETYEIAEKITTLYNVDLRVVRAAQSRKKFELKYGAELWNRDVDYFHWLTKIKPLQKELSNYSTWISARRRSQGADRASLPCIEKTDWLKVNPLARWSLKMALDYLNDKNIPYNRLHDQGYPSIGDKPLTVPSNSLEDERSGRWAGTGKTECGIHQYLERRNE